MEYQPTKEVMAIQCKIISEYQLQDTQTSGSKMKKKMLKFKCLTWHGSVIS